MASQHMNFSTMTQPQQEAPQSARAASISDLQALVENVRLSDGSVGTAAIDDVAEALRAKLNVNTDDNRLYRDLAGLLLKSCALKEEEKQYGEDSNRQHQQQLQQQSPPNNKLQRTNQENSFVVDAETTSTFSSAGTSGSPEAKDDGDFFFNANSTYIMSPQSATTSPVQDGISGGEGSVEAENENANINANSRGRSPGRVGRGSSNAKAKKSPLRLFHRTRPPAPTSDRNPKDMLSPKSRSRSPFSRLFRRNSKGQDMETAAAAVTAAVNSNGNPTLQRQGSYRGVTDLPPSGRCPSPMSASRPLSPAGASSFSPTESASSGSPRFATRTGSNAALKNQESAEFIQMTDVNEDSTQLPEFSERDRDNESERQRQLGRNAVPRAGPNISSNIEHEKPPLSRPGSSAYLAETGGSESKSTIASGTQQTRGRAMSPSRFSPRIPLPFRKSRSLTPSHRERRQNNNEDSDEDISPLRPRASASFDVSMDDEPQFHAENDINDSPVGQPEIDHPIPEFANLNTGSAVPLQNNDMNFSMPGQSPCPQSGNDDKNPSVVEADQTFVSPNATKGPLRTSNGAKVGNVTGKGKVRRKGDPSTEPLNDATKNPTGQTNDRAKQSNLLPKPGAGCKLFEVDLKKNRSKNPRLKRPVTRRNKAHPVAHAHENVEKAAIPVAAVGGFGYSSTFLPTNSVPAANTGSVAETYSHVPANNSRVEGSDGDAMDTDSESIGDVKEDAVNNQESSFNAAAAAANEQRGQFKAPSIVSGANDIQFAIGAKIATGISSIPSPGRRRNLGKGRSSRSRQMQKPGSALPTNNIETQRSETLNPSFNFEKADSPEKSVQSNSSNARAEYERMEKIKEIREEARSAYLAADYQASVLSYTKAIQILSEGLLQHAANDFLAVLLSNRAAGLQMVGAFDAAVSDCRKALLFVSDASSNFCNLSHDSGPVLKSKLYSRMGRALLKIGDSKGADKAFNNAVDIAQVALNICKQIHSSEEYAKDEEMLTQVATDATLGKTDCLRYSEVATLIARNDMPMSQRTASSERRIYVELLGHVNIALSTASGCPGLHEKKVSLLASLRRWREVAGHCERLAASNVQLDNAMTGDLSQMFPFPGVLPAKHLTANFFGDSIEEDYMSAELRLNSKAAAEAVLRLPYSVTSFYLRALRLEERYPAAEAAIQALESYVNGRAETHPHDRLRVKFAWLQREHSKLNRTKRGRERGDELFRAGDFDLAAAQYASCLGIDSEGAVDDRLDGTNSAGGRLHAVLHCNRAACLMAVRRFHDAVTDCTAALRIHSRYMKAMLRRARCYSRLERYEESVVEYRRWLELVDEAKKSDSSTSFVTPCLFDGPRDVSEDDIFQVRKELEEVMKMKLKKEAAARDEARYRQERQKFHNEAYTDAQRRRENWYSQKGNSGSRRWDTFGGKSPRKSNNKNAYGNNSNSWNGRSEYGGNSNSNSNNNSERSYVSRCPGSEPDHYRVLQVNTNATAPEIKKGYRKMALKYHPDKNQDPAAAEIFRRVKLAYEILNDPTSRRQYDMERLLKRSF